MEVIILGNQDEVARYSSGLFAHLLVQKPGAVLGLATGNTPLQTYKKLIELHRAGMISFRESASFNLDEYLGLAKGSALSYRNFMRRELFDHVDFTAGNTHFPECDPDQDPRKVGRSYEKLIQEYGGIDLQLLGIGSNGHIGFNEPTSSLGSRTRVKTLTKRTIEDNSSLIAPGEFQPHLAITMGIATILEARHILLLATGEHKAVAVKAAVEGSLAARHPASALQQHERVKVVLDEAAASQLELKDYYNWVRQESESLAARHRSPTPEDHWFRE